MNVWNWLGVRRHDQQGSGSNDHGRSDALFDYRRIDGQVVLYWQGPLDRDLPRWPEIIQGAPCPMRVGCHLVAPQANDVRKCRLSAVRPLCITSGWGGGG